MSAPVSQGCFLEALNMPLPHKGLPPLYQAFNHPLKPSNYGRSFVFFQNTTKESMDAIFALEESLTVPLGTPEEVEAMGYLRLRDGDYLFSRSHHGSLNGEDDVLLAWVCGGRVFTHKMRKDMDDARDAALGPKELRTRNKPVLGEDGIYRGGTAFERDMRAKPLAYGIRCYTMVNSLEKQNNIVAPCAATKTMGDIDDHLVLRKQMLKAATACSIAAMDKAPANISQAIREHSDLINMPRFGNSNNYAYATAQFNVSPAQAAGSGVSLTKDLGEFFGGGHADHGDYWGYFTNVISNSSLPDGYNPGCFFLLYPHVFIVMENNTSINFCGLRFHGGSPPTAPLGQEPSPDAYRYVMVSYPPEKMASGNARYTLGANADHSRFLLPPEVFQPDALEPVNRAWTTRGTFAADGCVTQDDTDVMTFMGRCLLAMNSYFLNQLPPRLKAQINSDEMLHALSFESHGHRVALGPWVNGPGWRKEGAPLDGPSVIESGEETFQINQNEKRRAMLKNWDAFSTKMGRHIPRAVHFKKVTPEPEPGNNPEVEDQLPANTYGNDGPGLEVNMYESVQDYEMEHSKLGNGPGGRPWSIIVHPKPKKKKNIRNPDPGNQTELLNIYNIDVASPDEADSSYDEDDWNKKKKAKEQKKKRLQVKNKKSQGKGISTTNKGQLERTKHMQLAQSDEEDPSYNLDVNMHSIQSVDKGRTRNGGRVVPGQYIEHDEDLPDTTIRTMTTPTSHTPSRKRKEMHVEIIQPRTASKKKKATQVHTWRSQEYMDLSTSLEGVLKRSGEASHHKDVSGCSTRMATRQRSNVPIADFDWHRNAKHQITGTSEMARGSDTTSARKENTVPRYITSLTLDCLHIELENVQQSLKARTYMPLNQIPIPSHSLEQIYKALSHYPISPASMTAISSIWKGLAIIEQDEGETSLNLRQQRKCVMSTNFGAWFWLDSYIAQQSRSVVYGSYQGGNDWISKLVKAIMFMRECRTPSKLFKAQEYDQLLPMREYMYKGSALKWDRGIDEEAAKVSEIAVEIIQHWLEFPLGNEANDRRRKARFVEIIIGEFGINALLLEQTWAAYNMEKRKMFSAGSANETDLSDMADPLRVAAQAHPLHNPDSEHYKILEQIGHACAIHQDSQNLVPYTSTTSHTTPAQNSHIMTMHSNGSTKLNRFVRYLREMVNLEMGNILPDQYSDLQRAVSLDRDRMLPFRECAPGRRRFSGNDGPFASNIIQTRAGLFSALIWRGITFTTKFSMTHQMVFKDLVEWKRVIGESSIVDKPPSYFCNINAYGIPNAFRCIALADVYWNATETQNWEDFNLAGMRNFNECYLGFFKPGKSPAVFPQIGPLCAFLLTADFAYGNAVRMPNIEDIGRAIQFINRGAATGLEHIGLIEERHKLSSGKAQPNLSQTVEGAKKVYEIMRSQMSDKEWNTLKIDEIVIENTLCKYSRAIKKKLI